MHSWGGFVLSSCRCWELETEILGMNHGLVNIYHLFPPPSSSSSSVVCKSSLLPAFLRSWLDPEDWDRLKTVQIKDWMSETSQSSCTARSFCFGVTSLCFQSATCLQRHLLTTSQAGSFAPYQSMWTLESKFCWKVASHPVETCPLHEQSLRRVIRIITVLVLLSPPQTSQLSLENSSLCLSFHSKSFTFLKRAQVILGL